MIHHNAVVLLMIAPLLGAGICLLEKTFPRMRCCKAVSAISLLVSFALLIPFYPAQTPPVMSVVGGWEAFVGIQQMFDGLAWLTCAVIFALSLLILLFAFAENAYDPTFYFLFLVSVAGMVGVMLAADLFNLFVCLEISGLASYVLIAYAQKGDAVFASFQYLLLSSLGMVFLLLGILIFYQHTGTLSLFDTAAYCAAHPELASTFAVGAAALMVGIGMRAAFVPFHAWLPDAHANAPHPVSALLSGLVIKIGFLAVWRIMSAFEMRSFQPLFLYLGAITAVVGAVFALAQADCKKLLAWHSISQMGYIVASFGVGTPLGLTASYAHVVHHAAFKSLLFLCVGSVIYMTGERSLKRLNGLAPALPLLSVAFAIGAGSIAGIPPFNGFVSKKMIGYSLEHAPVASLLISLAGVGTVASFLKLSAIFRPNHHAETPASIIRPLPPLAYLPLLALSAFCVLSGLFSGVWLNAISRLLFGACVADTLHLYAPSGLLHTIITVLLGAALYRGVISQRGQTVSATLRRIHLGLNVALLLLIWGFLLFSGVVFL